MSTTDRTLPVTPAERTAATMLRAWQAWQPDVTDPEPVRHMLAMFGVNAANAGLVYAETDDLTPAGRDLLARVDAAPMPLPPAPLLSDEAIKSPIAALLWFADEGHYEGTYRKGAGFAEACGMSIARKALGSRSTVRTTP